MPEEDRFMNGGVVAELELDGTIYYVEKDKDGKVVFRDALPGKSVMSALSLLLGQAMEAIDEAERIEEENK
jgi:hypothetical protein